MMVSPNQQWNSNAESRIIQDLERTYREQGFSFFSRPKSKMIPSFLGTYIPDALAIKGSEHILIEVKLKQNSTSERMFADLRRKLSGHKGWKLNVVYAAGLLEDDLIIEVPRANLLKERVIESHDLAGAGHTAAAFLLAWATLEATLNFRNKTVLKGQLRAPGQIVQTLSMNGYIDEATERSLRNLLQLRNKIVHGDLSTTVSGEDIQVILDAVTDILSSD